MGMKETVRKWLNEGVQFTNRRLDGWEELDTILDALRDLRDMNEEVDFVKWYFVKGCSYTLKERSLFSFTAPSCHKIPDEMKTLPEFAHLAGMIEISCDPLEDDEEYIGEVFYPNSFDSFMTVDEDGITFKILETKQIIEEDDDIDDIVERGRFVTYLEIEFAKHYSYK